MNECAELVKADVSGGNLGKKVGHIQKRYFNVEEIAFYLCMSKPTIYRYVEEMRIPCFKIRKILRFDIVEIEKWLKEFKREPLL